MSANTATAKRISRTLRASPVKERTPLPREDIENLSAVTLAALGMAPSSSSSSGKSRISPDASMAATTPQPSDRVLKRMSKTSNEMYATPPATVMPVKSRTVSSSSRVSSAGPSIINNNNSNTMSSGRNCDRTTTSSSTASSEQSHASQTAPLTAIRRPAPQSHHQNTPPASSQRSASGALSAGRAASGSYMKASPSQLKMSTNGSSSAIRSRKASNSALPSSRDTPSSVRSRAPSTDASKHLSQHEEEREMPAQKGVFVTQEEHSSLVALLSAKDEQIASLKEHVEEGRKEVSGLKERNNKLQKEKDALVLEKKDLLKAMAVSSNGAKEGNNSHQGEEGSISKREYETFKKQYEMQENLLEGFQRENEKATVELEALKKREKHLNEQLKKIYGPTFSIDNDFNPLTPEHNGPLKRFPISLLSNGHGPGSPLSGGMLIGGQHRRRSGFGLVPASLDTSSLVNSSDGDGDASGSIGQKGQAGKNAEIEPALLMEQLVSVQSLLERFEKRLLVRESELIKKEREATEQLEKLQKMVDG